MDTWFGYLKRGFSRGLPDDPLAGQRTPAGARASLANLRPFLARHWSRGLLGACLVLVSTLLSLPQPLLLAYLVDQVILAGRLERLLPVVALMVAVAAGGLLANALQQFYFARFEQEVILDIQNDLLNRTLRFPKSFFDEQEVGYLMARLSTDVLELRWFFSSTLVDILTNALRLLGGLALLFYLEWRLALVALLLIPGLLIWVRLFSGRIRALSHHTLEREARVARRLQESLSSTSLIKAFASEEREIGRVMSELRGAFQISLEQTAVDSLAGLSLTILNQAGNLVVLLAGAYWIIAGQWTLGALLAFRSYLSYVYGPAFYLAHVNLQLQSALAALQRVSALFDIVPEETGAGLAIERLRGEVEFRSVSFTYNNQPPVLHDLSCRVSPGEHVAIVGASGVGKTTLVSLMLRFYKPTAGEIWFDGRPASDYEVTSLRRRIGYVSQATLLLSGTIMDNLCYGNPGAAEADVFRAAQIAGIHDFIAGLPEGYLSLLGERGVNLSEGQKQRLAIARALIKDPDILVLDEPTSALDSIVERSIFDALPALVRDKTLFVVAHRLSTIQSSDRILLLNENRLVAIGTHHSLLETSEFYRALVAGQVAPAG